MFKYRIMPITITSTVDFFDDEDEVQPEVEEASQPETEDEEPIDEKVKS